MLKLHKKPLLFFSALALLISLVALPKILGIKTLSVKAPASAALNPADWREVLENYVQEGQVDYQGLKEHPQALHRYIAGLARHGPKTEPQNYRKSSEKLAYYLNAYNALVVFAVVENWPLESVRDVKGRFEPKKGFGFFYALRFKLDGDTINLYDLENQVIRRLGDARIHAAINCASTACPVLQSFAYTAEELESQLDQVTQSFVNHPLHLQVDEKGVVHSKIFSWYQKDFEKHAKKLGEGDSFLAWAAHYPAPEHKEKLLKAEKEQKKTQFRPYDWSVNKKK